MPDGPSRRLRYWPPMRSQRGKDSSSWATGNSHVGPAGALGAAPDWAAVLGSELVWVLTCPGAVLTPTKRRSDIRAFILIEIVPHRLMNLVTLSDLVSRACNPSLGVQRK